MQVTEVKIRRAQTAGKVRAYASVTLDDAFAVHQLRVIDGPNGLFIAMPSVKGQDGSYRDIAHPITREARQVIHDAVLWAYEADQPQDEW